MSRSVLGMPVPRHGAGMLRVGRDVFLTSLRVPSGAMPRTSEPWTRASVCACGEVFTHEAKVVLGGPYA